MSRLAPLFFLTFLFSCMAGNHENPITNGITINGKITGLAAKKIYLADAFEWKTILDSADCVNNEFTFKLTGEPFAVALHFKNDTGKSKYLFYIDPYSSKGDKLMRNQGFFPGKSVVTITGDYTKNELHVDAGKDGELFYTTGSSLNVGYLGKSTGAQRERIIQGTKKLITENPGSYVLIKGLFRNKYQHSNEELKALLSLFDTTIQNSNYGKRLQAYIRIRPNPGDPAPNIVMTSLQNEQQLVIDSMAKVNLLVLWASWCGPCRMEIPYIKKTYAQFKGRGLHIAGISIDTDKEKWTSAIQQYNLQWPQYISSPSQKEELEALYNFSAIPVLIFTDRSGNILDKYVGFDEKEAEQYVGKLEQWLSN